MLRSSPSTSLARLAAVSALCLAAIEPTTTAASAQPDAAPAKAPASDALSRFATIHKGTRVVDLIPGDGIFTQAFSTKVGRSGRVYALVPTIFLKAHPEALDGLNTLARAAPGTIDARSWMPGAILPEAVDVVWNSQSYHDIHNAGAGTIPAVNCAVFNMLKPGGLYVVVDHAAAGGAGTSTTSTLHRIEEVSVRSEVEAAGFIFAGDSPILRNAYDTHTLAVSDPAIKGKTDRFVLRFRKPFDEARPGASGRCTASHP